MWGGSKEKKGGKAKILFLDTEIISPNDNSNPNDAKVFALIALISTLMIYNTRSSIDEIGINEFNLVTQLSNSIATNVSH